MSPRNYQEYPQSQRLEIPFQVPRRQPCTATINVKPEDNPECNGQHLLDFLPYPTSARKGFPAIEIKIHSPQSRGYAAIYGWIQIVAQGMEGDRYNPLPENLASAPWKMDPIPSTEHLDTPFTWLGVEPTLFDGPSTHGVEKQDWVCRSILCYLETSVGSGEASSLHPKPIFIVEWGYWIDDYRPRVKEVKQVDVTVWNDHLELFRSWFPKWTFSEVGT